MAETGEQGWVESLLVRPRRMGRHRSASASSSSASASRAKPKPTAAPTPKPVPVAASAEGATAATAAATHAHQTGGRPTLPKQQQQRPAGSVATGGSLAPTSGAAARGDASPRKASNVLACSVCAKREDQGFRIKNCSRCHTMGSGTNPSASESPVSKNCTLTSRPRWRVTWS
jgi:hypothetical protein